MNDFRVNNDPIIVKDDNYVIPVDDIKEVKTIVINKIAKIIAKKGWNQKHAAKVLGIDQPKISHIKNGKSAGFSLERLLKFLSLVGYGISFSLTGINSDNDSKIYDSEEDLHRLTRHTD